MISVCLAAFNGEKYIKEQINSILIQLRNEDELIISDDGSTDHTLEIVNNFLDHRIKVFHNITNHGYSKNFENALKHATGDYIFFSDQDDIWLPNKIETMILHLSEDALVLTDAYITNEKLEITGKLSDWRRYKKGYLNNIYKNIYTGCTCAFTKNIKEYSLPFPDTNYIMYDNWIGLLCELKFKVKYIDEPLILHRRHNTNTSSMTNKSSRTVLFMIKYRIQLLIKTLAKRFTNS